MGYRRWSDVDLVEARAKTVHATTTPPVPASARMAVTHVSIALGIVIGLLASFVQSLGLTIQRKSHVLNERLPEHEQRLEHRRPYVSVAPDSFTILNFPLDYGSSGSPSSYPRIFSVHWFKSPHYPLSSSLLSEQFLSFGTLSSPEYYSVTFSPHGWC